jgi:hypothetical protein
MESLRTVARFGACIALAALVTAASLPSAMTGPGQWEVSKSAEGSGGQRTCLADPAMLTQWEHRGKPCTRVILSSDSDHAEVHYTCVGGGFGTSKVEVLTPRTLRIDTQGISDGYPFAYVLHARRVGDCPAH